MERRVAPALYAHRGYHDKPAIPENSLPAFRRAIERKWGAELDVHILKDGTLAVFHDSELERCTGEKGILEDLDFESMRRLHLEGTQEPIPTFDEVLDLFEHSGSPLIIELKTYRHNHKALTEAVCRRLDRYTGTFCLESFDPFAVLELKKLRPAFIRGQLARNFRADPWGMGKLLAAHMTDLRFNCLTKPDFVAYQFADRDVPALQKALKKGMQEVNWTIRCKEDLEAVLRNGALAIFEKFDPDE